MYLYTQLAHPQTLALHDFPANNNNNNNNNNTIFNQGRPVSYKAGINGCPAKLNYKLYV